MTKSEVMEILASLGNEQTKNTYIRHGAQEPIYGVKIGDLKKIRKNIKKNHDLALSLFNSGNSDAMYLAALIADEKQITKDDLNAWCKMANWYYLSEYAVAGIASESKFGLELGLEWIKSGEENIASSGWATLSNWVSIRDDNHLDKILFTELLNKVQSEIHTMPNRVRYTMNGFVISVGTYIHPLTEKALVTANAIGRVKVNMGETFCKVPQASSCIEKSMDANKIGIKRKSVRC